jgi:hypothetical protein
VVVKLGAEIVPVAEQLRPTVETANDPSLSLHASVETANYPSPHAHCITDWSELNDLLVAISNSAK